MLNSITKRRIDSARDILVGKVPDPKAQVEQITTALIYKFMDDMDKTAEELGGEASFFANGYQQYAWSKLLDPRLSGYERLNLYADALTKMHQNPHLPQLFRDIFKDAFLPYRDPETLNLFLKEINGFSYDNSEELGNAFEYLLSIMDSQGDAGQFRTPRHIIDFIVSVVDPTKEDTILDPACGTAGFLISAYKHILKQNGVKRPGDQLTPEDKSRLIQHFVGYDISPDMERLSLVNMYLHDFPDPKIYEYDTLTSEERWEENYDVIMANPPFMTPKGGIRPHKRFSIQASRSEVLFVDYIAEHLTIHGRAGVIVPEGIIFQSGNAYKGLRKMLVEKYLWAVVSLPAGVFQPYSGVKTSILLMDKNLTKKAESILFVRIANDGFDLGAQRRVIEKNDLPKASAILQRYKQALQENNTTTDFFNNEETAIAVIVEKSRITKNGDYNLSGVRYREEKLHIDQKWPIMALGEICKPEYGFTETAMNEGDTRFIRITDIEESGSLKSDDPKFINISDESRPYLLHKGELLVARTGATFGKTLFFNEDYQAAFASYLIRLKFDSSKINNRFYWFLTRSDEYQKQKISLVQGGGQPQFNGNVIIKIKIPVPPLDIQHEIVAELENYQKIIEGAKQIVNIWQPVFSIDENWPILTVEDVSSKEKNSIKAGPFGSSLKKEFYVEDGYKIYGQEQVIRDDLDYGDYYIDERKFEELKSCAIKSNDILISLVGTYGKISIVPQKYKPGIINPRLMKVTLDQSKILPLFFKYIFQSDMVSQQLKNLSYGGTMGILNTAILREIKIPVPSIEAQQQIIAQIEEEQQLIAANKRLIEIFEQKIKDKIAEVWGS